MKIVAVFVGVLLVLLAMYSPANATQNLSRDRMVRPLPPASQPAYQGAQPSHTVINNHTTIINNRPPASRFPWTTWPSPYYSSYYYAGSPIIEVDAGVVVTGVIGRVVGVFTGQRLVPLTPVVVVPSRYVVVAPQPVYISSSPPPSPRVLTCSYPGSAFETTYPEGASVPRGMICVSR